MQRQNRDRRLAAAEVWAATVDDPIPMPISTMTRWSAMTRSMRLERIVWVTG
jgi:hypothetical protein